MPITTTSLTSAVLALAAVFLALSLLVQVMQEVYKYLSSSRSKSFVNTLTDFLGPHAEQLTRPGVLPDLQVRGPFQFLRRRPVGHLQPMDKDDLLVALERTAAPWIQRALSALRLEASFNQAGSKKPSPSFDQFLRQLHGTVSGAPGHATALEVQQFLGDWGIKPNSTTAFDAHDVHKALRTRFLPSVVRAEENFTQLVKNFDHNYRRRNLRQTFVFGFLLAFVAQQPLDEIYRAAREVPLDQAMAAAERAQAIYASEAARDTSVVRDMAELREVAKSLTATLDTAGAKLPWHGVTVRSLGAQLLDPGYVVGCLFTALLISFGAPFWNDLTGALLRVYKGRVPVQPEETDRGKES